MPGSVMIWELTVGKRQILTFQARSPLWQQTTHVQLLHQGKKQRVVVLGEVVVGMLACYSWTLGERSHETIF